MAQLSTLGHIEYMPVMFADFDPGALTGMLIVVLFGFVVIGCLIAAGVAALAKKQEAVSGLLTAAGICFGIGAVLFILDMVLAKRFHLL